MMTDGEVSSRERAVERPTLPSEAIAGQSSIRHALEVHAATPDRSRFARFFGASPLSTAGRLAYRAAMGEVEVGTALEDLGEGWHVLHSVPVADDGTELDHLVIGTGGVYIVTTTAHAGAAVYAEQRTFQASDIRYPHIRNMEYEMGRVERLLSSAARRPVEVSGILAVVESKSLVVREPHRDVAVLRASSVNEWLAARPEVIARADVEAIASAAELPTTWRPAPPVSGDPVLLRADFAELHRRVTRAWNVQKLWATAMTVVGAGAFILVTYRILLIALKDLGA